MAHAQDKRAADGAEALYERLGKLKREEKMDLSSGEDLSVAIMNLISIEEHLFFTGAKLGQDRYFDMLNEVRTLRVSLLKRLVKDPKGEEWCISKHLLASTYRVMEVGTKELSLGRKEEAKSLFESAFGLYSLFWGVALRGTEGASSGAASVGAVPAPQAADASLGFMEKMKAVAKKAIDCCIE